MQNIINAWVGNLEAFLQEAVGYVWGMPLVILLVGSGVLFTLLLGFIQFRGFFHSIKVVLGKYDNPGDPGAISHFQALTTALSATVGLGNIAGVAFAIKAGGPGAVFWMIMTGLVGMATKFSECSLALMYRKTDDHGEVHGGPMYYIVYGLGKKFYPLAIFYSICLICATFGAGNMFQTNQVANILNAGFQVPTWLTGLILAILTAAVILGGIKRIGGVTSKLVPLMGGIYVFGALIVIALNYDQIGNLIYSIFHDAFNGTAIAGGALGATIKIALDEVVRQGVRRACFSNEAGLGSSPIAHAAAATKEPIREGIVALLEPLIDTVVICTMTALVILISGKWMDPNLTGVELTAAAFDSGIPGFGKVFVPVAVFLFAYSTLLSWSYYGETMVDFVSSPSKSKKNVLIYKIAFCIAGFMGAIWAIEPVLNFSDIMLGLMVVPNLLSVWLLFPKLKAATNEYFRKLQAGEFEK
ncbi:MAG: sodium:alanine symporter family protein [Bdellovibrionaceae bacterium]|nr:sodium:alanine symporter family protein [Pseudobdellovibrionaceae bacterium]